jgi:hypothetical protein
VIWPAIHSEDKIVRGGVSVVWPESYALKVCWCMLTHADVCWNRSWRARATASSTKVPLSSHMTPRFSLSPPPPAPPPSSLSLSLSFLSLSLSLSLLSLSLYSTLVLYCVTGLVIALRLLWLLWRPPHHHHHRICLQRTSDNLPLSPSLSLSRPPPPPLSLRVRLLAPRAAYALQLASDEGVLSAVKGSWDMNKTYGHANKEGQN